tara:strand:+ start:909 stop:1163 length:255 start_codon:yes stop_codon:yes gene_type:complete
MDHFAGGRPHSPGLEPKRKTRKKGEQTLKMNGPDLGAGSLPTPLKFNFSFDSVNEQSYHLTLQTSALEKNRKITYAADETCFLS